MTTTKVVLPKVLYVALRGADTDAPYFEASSDMAACIEDDGPTPVGMYQLHHTKSLKKVVQEGGR